MKITLRNGPRNEPSPESSGLFSKLPDVSEFVDFCIETVPVLSGPGNSLLYFREISYFDANVSRPSGFLGLCRKNREEMLSLPLKDDEALYRFRSENLLGRDTDFRSFRNSRRRNRFDGINIHLKQSLDSEKPVNFCKDDSL